MRNCASVGVNGMLSQLRLVVVHSCGMLCSSIAIVILLFAVFRRIALAIVVSAE